MASSIYIPASSSGGGAVPQSVSVKTASYTIPVGKYAEIIPSILGTTANYSAIQNANLTIPTVGVTINGSYVFYGESSGSIIFNNNATTRTVTFPARGNVTVSNLSLSASPSPVQYVTIDGQDTRYGNALFTYPSGPVSLVCRTMTLTTTSSSSLSTAAYFTWVPFQQPKSFIVPAGTVISGSGAWSALVTEYNV